MSQEAINKSLQNTLLSPLTHDSLWSQFLNSFSYELENMREQYSLIKDNWNINKNNKSNLIRISESFGYTPNLTIDNTVNLAKREIESIPYRIREKTTYDGYSLIFQQNGYLGDTFNYYWNGYKLIKVIDYDKTIENLINSNHYSPFFGIETIKNYSSILNSNNVVLDYLVNGKKVYDEYNIRYYSLDQRFNPFWKLDTSYVKITTKHLGIEYFPQTYYCTYNTTMGIADEDNNIYESQIQLPNYYIEKSMIIKINNIILPTQIENIDGKEYFRDDNDILNLNSYFDVTNNLVHLEFNQIPIDYEISIEYNINLFMTSDYFYYLEQGMEYNRRCPIIPHSGIFMSVDIASSRGSDFYYENENNYTIPDLKIKAVTSSAYNRFITLSGISRLDNATDESGQPTGDENYKLDSLIKWFLDTKTSQSESLLNKFKYIACGNRPLSIINEKYNQTFNQNSIVFYYNLNSDNDTFKIFDLSLNQLDCTVVGNDVKISSIINKSLNFNGETYAHSNSTLAIDSTLDYTLGVWFKCSDNQSSLIGTLFDSFINISYDYENQKIIIDSNEFNCSKNEYHFMCLFFNSNSNTIDVYIDCVLLGTFNFTITSISSLLYIGTNSSITDNFYGEIDNIWLLSKIISNEQMSYIYNEKISVISRMGNRLAYYELSDDEKYENDKYTIIQSYVKSMDINNESIMLHDNPQDESENYSSQTKFYPILPSYFYMNYVNTMGKTVTIQSNEKGEFHNKETGEIITGNIDFENGIWNLAKNTIKSISQKNIVNIHELPYKHDYAKIYNVIDELDSTDVEKKGKWYSEYNVKTGSHDEEIIADEYVTDISTDTVSTFIYNDDNDSVPKTNIYSNDNEIYYVYSDDNQLAISSYIVDSDENKTPLFSSNNGKSLFLNLTDLISNENQIKAFVDLGEKTGTTLYSQDNGITMYLDVACSSDKQIKKYELTLSDNTKTICYTLGQDNPPNAYYSDLSFTSIISPTDVQSFQVETFNPMQMVIKFIQSDLKLTLIKTVYEYHDIYTIDYIQSFQVEIEHYSVDLVKDSINFNYWLNEDNVLVKYTATVSSEGEISGKNILSGYFDYSTNVLTVLFENKVNSDIIVSYEYYYSLDINYEKPLIMNYKTEKSIQINEIGLEDENHELMAYMTFPNIEFHTIYNNASVLFAIAKS